MTSTIASASFQPRPAISALHLAGHQSSYATSTMQSSQPAANFEGIVDFSYHQPHYSQFNPQPSESSLQHHQATASRVDAAEWKQSSFFSYRPNEVKHRKRTTRQQLKVLEETFRTTQKPDGNVRKSLAQQLNMTPRNVQVWFQNRRAKDKTLAKRALKTVEEKAASPELDAEATGNSNENSASPVASQHAFYPSESYSPQTVPSSEHRYSASVDTHSGSASPIETVFPAQYEVPIPIYVANDQVLSPASSSFSGHAQTYQVSSSFGSETSAGTQFPAAYARDLYAPRASLPHIHATTFQQDSQHQRSSSSPSFPSSVDSSSNLPLATYAGMNAAMYPQQRFSGAMSQPVYATTQRTSAGPLPASDFTFGMHTRSQSDAEGDSELTGYASYSQFGSVSGSDTPSSIGGLSHYGSVASLAESARSFDEETPFGWKGEQRRGSIPLGIRPSFAALAGRGFSPLSVGYSSNSPCPIAEPESDCADNAIYMAGRLSFKREEVDPNQTLGYQQDPFAFNGQDANPATYQYLAYGQQQNVADNVMGFSFTNAQPEMSDLQMPRPTAYGTYGFA